MGIRHWGMTAVGLLALAVAADGWAQSAAEIIEQARARARQVEEIKQVLNDPDQNVRLAAFEAMVGSDDSLMRELALDAGLNSTDEVLRGMALRQAVLGLAQLTITLAVDTAAPKAIQDSSREFLEKNGNSYVMAIDPKTRDLSTGAFNMPGNVNQRGNVSGRVVTFKYPYYTGELHLQEDNTLAGTVHYQWSSNNHQFKATAPLR
jgi:hypothetical protein